eukprot:GGOE01046021.1.p1 GENE.GGOE01046021.1~~GGOE01046021.1.p1  ORF type:complete len:268 (+),score=84.10 GGOE01046021.1:81-806(+)
MADGAPDRPGGSSIGANSLQLGSAATFQGSPARSLNARHLRLMAEHDVQCLAHRIAKLKAEEARAKREIHQAAARERILQEGQQRREERSAADLQRQLNATAQRETHTQDREEHLRTLLQVRQRLLTEKQEQYQSMRKERAINECRMQIGREEVRDRNTKLREEMQHTMLGARLRREQQLQVLRERAKELTEERMAQEEAERARTEQVAQRLMVQEAELLCRLSKLSRASGRPATQLAPLH